VFDLSITKLLFLAVIALVVFGPNELPRIARQAGRALRDLRQIAEGAKADLREGLGPEFQDFDFEDLNPRRFVHKHLFEEQEPETQAERAATTTAQGVRQPHVPASQPNATRQAGAAAAATAAAAAPAVQVDDRPPFDLEAT
jgi:sec-independent protein translocase protein TatB